MRTKSREVIWGGQIMGTEVRARHAREGARKAAREADQAEDQTPPTNSTLPKLLQIGTAGIVPVGTFWSLFALYRVASGKERKNGKARKSSRGHNQDRARSPAGRITVGYTAKNKRSAAAVKKAVKKVGSSRKKVERRLGGKE
jgi:hypothetical protein